MKHCFNKNINGKWIRVFANQDDINNAKKETIEIFGEAIEALDAYKSQRKALGKRDLTKDEENALILLLTSHYVFRLETLMDTKIETGEIFNEKYSQERKELNKEVVQEIKKEENITDKYKDVEF